MPRWVWAAIGLAVTLVILSVAYRIFKKNSGATVKVGKFFEVKVETQKKLHKPVEEEVDYTLNEKRKLYRELKIWAEKPTK